MISPKGPTLHFKDAEDDEDDTGPTVGRWGKLLGESMLLMVLLIMMIMIRMMIMIMMKKWTACKGGRLLGEPY